MPYIISKTLMENISQHTSGILFSSSSTQSLLKQEFDKESEWEKS